MLPIILDYSTHPSEDYWKHFLFSPLPSKPCTRINIDAFKKQITHISARMSQPQCWMVAQVIFNLCNVSHTLINPAKLASNIVPNKPMNIKCTDIIATWLHNGILVATFSSPPIQGFCSIMLFFVKVIYCMIVQWDFWTTGGAINKSAKQATERILPDCRNRRP